MPLFLKAVLCILAVELLGSLPAWFSSGDVSGWYQSLNRPPGTPPSWAFGVVWPMLFALIGLSLALIWHHPSGDIGKGPAYSAFAIQFLLNLLWTPVFFNLKAMLPALVIIVLLIAAVILTIYLFNRHSRTAALLLVPYLLWICYATWLNTGFLLWNR